jgi:HTH-type transcriptional regulator/antitoxin HigA
MATKTKTVRRRKIADSYLNLVMECPLTSIRSEGQLATAQSMMDRLLAQGDLDDGEEMYLDALSDLVASYEDVHHAIAPASDADMLRHLLEAKGISQVELHRGSGIPKSTISEILAGKKTFSKSLIRTLADFFQVDTSVLASNL